MIIILQHDQYDLETGQFIGKHFRRTDVYLASFIAVLSEDKQSFTMIKYRHSTLLKNVPIESLPYYVVRA